MNKQTNTQGKIVWPHLGFNHSCILQIFIAPYYVITTEYDNYVFCND